MRAWLRNAASTVLASVIVLLVIAVVLWGVYKEPATVGSFATAGYGQSAQYATLWTMTQPHCAAPSEP